MDSSLVRVLVALLLAAFLYFQARALTDRPHRRRAFQLAAAALLALAGYNVALAAGVAPGPLQIAIAVIGAALFVGALASLLLSLSAGEARDQREQIARAAREYRERQKDKGER
jgi:hypothetical protein